MYLFDDADSVKHQIEEYELKLENDKYISYGVDIVRKRRDTILVHNDRKYFGEKTGDDSSYLPKYILWIMRDFANEVLDYISLHLGYTPEHCAAKYDGDLDKLLKLPTTIRCDQP